VDAALRFCRTALVAELQQRGEPLNVAERVAEMVGFAWPRGRCTCGRSRNSVALAVPLFAERRLRGLYLLGLRRSGDAFSRDDVALLFASRSRPPSRSATPSCSASCSRTSAPRAAGVHLSPRVDRC
jgi:hypothetical protein